MWENYVALSLMGPVGSPLTASRPGQQLSTRLAVSQKAQTHIKGAHLAAGVSEILRRAHHIIHHVGIGIIGDIVEAESPCPKVVNRRKPALQTEVDIEVIGKAH